MRRRPPCAGEQSARQRLKAACADQPETAVAGRTEHEIVAAEQAKGVRDVAGTQRRNIAADQYHRARRQQLERQRHALPEIAPPLRTEPWSGTRASPDRMAESIIGRHEQ